MDGLVTRFDAVETRGLMVCKTRGVSYQRDIQPFSYGKDYFDRYVSLEDSEIAKRINKARVDLVDRHAGTLKVLDVGIGSGEFIRNRPNTYGYDINPEGVAWLLKRGCYSDHFGSFTAFTFWDVLEHVKEPEISYFRHVRNGSFLFCSLPIFDDLAAVWNSKHYKPNEHLYYWTERGFIEWMREYRFRLLEVSDVETQAGRESIKSFAFIRDLPGYHDTIDQYRKLYEPNYGASAYLYFDQVAKEVAALNPSSILDYGCGRSDLVAHFWNEGKRRIAKYDPAISQFKEMPEGTFDLVICCDVMEHIPMCNIERVLKEVKRKSESALFTISMKPARAKLPDGRNAHVSLLSGSEWVRWIEHVFDRKTRRIPVHDDKIIMLATYGA